MNLRAKVSGFIVLAVVAAGALPAAVAQGSPLDDKKAQAASLQRQIDANGERAGMLAEKLNGARIRLNKAQAGIADAERRTQEAQAATDKIQAALNTRAAKIYMGAGSSNPLDAVDVKNVTDLAARSKYAAAAADHDDSLLTQLQIAREDLAIRKAQLEQQKAAAQAEKDAADTAKRQLDASNARLASLQRQVNGEIQQLIQQEQARQLAAARARAQATIRNAQNGGGGGSARRSSGPVNFPNVPAPNARAGQAVAFAKAQVGKGYRYATSGPDTFDCSGLTAAAWASAGVGLAHYSGAQYNQTIHIGAGDLQPGDLVFYGPGGSRHVEIYIGGGMVVSASNPATGVKLAAVRFGSASGYGRVRG
jgi:cell wall-associated NlpC family hydrolase